MSAQKKTAVTTVSVLGTALFALGTAFLLGKFLLLLSGSGAALIGPLPALGTVVLRASTTLPFAGHGVFAVVLSVLVSFWPLLLIAAGSALLLHSEVAKNRRGARG